MTKKQKQLNNSKFKLTPLGGVAEIGSNMMLVETANDCFIIDCGILFPDDDFFDINYLIPDFRFIDDEGLKPTHLVITHGHEDHIGAVPMLMQKYPDLEIWAPPFSADLIRHKFSQRNMSYPITVYREDDIIDFVDIDLHPIHMNHSIPETFGILMVDRKKEYSAFYASDYKVDPDTKYEEYFNFKKIQKLTAGIDKRLFFSDSTNILNPGKTDSEKNLFKDLEHVITTTPHRCFVTMFSSNIHRIQTIVNICKKHDLKLTFVGRSIYKYTEIAEQNNLLHDLKQVFVKEESITDTDDRVVALLTGCQGDFFGALRRIASGEHKKFKFWEGDRVIFSSKPIPGNEDKIYKIYNQITETGAEIVTAHDYRVHASGHPGQEDLKIAIKEVNPTDYIPIHGEIMFLRRHCEFAQREFPKINNHFIKNFSTIALNKDNEVIIVPREPLDPILIHGKHMPIEREAISERRKVAQRGAVFISVSMTNKKPELQLTAVGLPNYAESHLDRLRLKLKGQIMSEKMTTEEINESCRIECKRFFAMVLGYRPQTYVHTV